MPNPDLTAIIASLPPLTFTPADEAPVSLTRWYLVAPIANDDWLIAHREENGWFCQDGTPLDPLVVAALPRMPGGHQAGLKYLASALEERIDNGDLDQAERLLDELRDEVRATRRLAAR
jgi:hypothetical protein